MIFLIVLIPSKLDLDKLNNFAQLQLHQVILAKVLMDAGLPEQHK